MTRTSSRQQVTVDVGDVEIGAVEIKDASSSSRVNVVDDGTNFAMVVKQNEQPLPTGAATEATLDSFYQDFFDTLDNGFHTIRTNIISNDANLIQEDSTVLGTIDSNTFNTYQQVQTLNTVDFATQEKQDDVITELQQANTYLASSVAQEATLQNIESYSATTSTDTSSIDSKTPALGQALMAGSVPVTIASDQPIEPDYHDAVAQGIVADTLSVTMAGRNPDIDTAAEEDIWGNGGVWAPITAAQTLTIVSSSAADTLAGTGARVVQVTGLDASYNRVVQNYNMNGVTPVVTAHTWTFMESVIVVSSGTGQRNAGTITITATTDTTAQGPILPGFSTTSRSFFMVPAGYLGYIHQVLGASASGTAGTLTNIYINYMIDGTNTWVRPVIYRSRADGSASFAYDINFPYQFPPKTLIKFSADTSNNNTVVDVFYQVELKLI
jgi:hypothetical protein